ncbi:MAG TPA: methyltransferase [Chitinispirillaceae bacterium]|nr:methyltransferase [Chitinispirillaceae bacterium]
MSAKLTIEKMVYGGYGLARTGSGVVFVHGALPGEEVEVSEESRVNGSTIAIAREILKASPARREPPCRYAGECGGCDWLHIEYSEQLLCKKEILIDCFRRIGKLEIPEPQVFSSPQTGYRIRAQIKVSRSASGFFKKKTNEIVEIRNCPLLSDSLNSLLESDLSGRLNPEKTVNFKVIAGENGIASVPPLKNLTSDKTEIRAGESVFIVNGNSFFQGNRYLLEQMGHWGASEDTDRGNLVDLYGGVGFFSVMMGKGFKKIVLVESLRENILEAERNFELNRFSNFKVVHSEVEKAFTAVPSEPDLLIVDPPRPGLTRKAREAVRSIKAQEVLYVSCNPSTQARDVHFFVKECGYRIKRSALFDLYPNTHHLESLMLLARD